MPEQFDIAIIGAGPAGYVGAIRAAQLGAKVVLFEKGEVGGTCLNVGCIPTKTLVASTALLSKIKRAAEYGIELDGQPRPNFQSMLERARKVIDIEKKGIMALFEKYRVHLVHAEAALAGKGRVRARRADTSRDAREELFGSDRVLIATGSRPVEFADFPFDGRSVLSSDDFFTMSEIPESILIIGAGVIGCEFAFILAELGCAVTIIEMMERALPLEDAEISKVLEREMKKRKIKLRTRLKVVGIEKEEGGKVGAKTSDGSMILSEKILISIGREFCTSEIGLEETGVNRSDKGSIVIDEKLETNVPGIYAAGDVTGGLMLAHVAWAEAITAVENSFGKSRTLEYESIPWGIFTNPEIGRVGLTEQEAIKKGMKLKIGRFNFRLLGKAHAMGEIEGFVKILADADDDRVIGAHIIGPHATDMIHEIALGVRWKMKASQVASLIHTHPTLSEAVMEAAGDIYNEAIHLPPK